MAADLYGWFPTMSQPLVADEKRWTIPERAPNALIGDTSAAPDRGMLGFTSEPRGPMSQMAYELAGSPRSKPPLGTDLPYVDYLDTDSLSGGGGALGLLGGQNPISGLNNVRSALSPPDPAIQQPSQLNELGSKLGLTSGLSGGWGSGANLNAAVQSQLGGAPASLGATPAGALTASAPAAVLAADFGTIGSGAAANAALAEAGFGPGAAAGTGASAGAGAGASAFGAVAQALPIAAIGWLAADLLNQSGDKASSATTQMVKSLVDNQGWTLANPKNQTYRMPDGRFIQVGSEARAVSEALRKGDYDTAQSAYEAWLATARMPKGG